MLKARFSVILLLFMFAALAIVPLLAADPIPITPGSTLRSTILDSPLLVELHLDKATLSKISYETTSTGLPGVRFQSSTIDAFFVLNTISLNIEGTEFVVKVYITHTDNSGVILAMTNATETEPNLFKTKNVYLDNNTVDTISALTGDLSVQIQKLPPDPHGNGNYLIIRSNF